MSAKPRMQAWVFRVLAVLAAGFAWAEPVKTSEQDVNAIHARLLELQTVGRERARRLARALSQGVHDTPEMRETRRRIQQIQSELLEAERALKQQFEALPAVQAERRQAAEEMDEARQLDARLRKDGAPVEKNAAPPPRPDPSAR